METEYWLNPLTQNEILRHHGAETADKCADYFTALSLPIPASRETFHTSDDGYIVFLNRFGMTLRLIRDRDYPLFDDPRILQPIASRRIGDLRADLYPGIYSGVSTLSSMKLRSRLLLKGIDYWDALPRNGGYLPRADGTGPDRHAVVLDAGACRKLNVGARAVMSLLRLAGKSFASAPKQNPQDTLYKNLRDSFNAAWPAESDRPNPGKMQSFWDLCLEEKALGRLVTTWNERDFLVFFFSDHETIPEISGGYEARLKAHEDVYGPLPLDFSKPGLP
jgi:hypothetical protein